MASLSAFFSYDANTMDRGIPYYQFTAFQYNTGGNAWYNPTVRPTDTLFVVGDNYGGAGTRFGITKSPLNLFAQLTGSWGQISSGATHTIAQSAGTTKWFSTGYNYYGQLATSDFDDRLFFTAITGNWSQMNSGVYHNMALSAGTSTKWYGSGDHNQGQLGIGAIGGGNKNRSQFTQIPGDWSTIQCGGRHTMALSAGTNTLFATGYNFSGQLGLGNSGLGTERSTFTQLTGNWSQIKCGYDSTMALSAGTNVWFGTGENNGQFGQGGIGNNRNTFTALTGNWSQIVYGGYGSDGGVIFALSAGTNRWFGAGKNYSGTLGFGTSGSGNPVNTFTMLTGNWEKILCKGTHAMALSAGTNRWFAAGSNNFGELAIGTSGGAGTNVKTFFTPLTGNWSQILPLDNCTFAVSARDPMASPLVVDNFENQPITFKMRPITNSGVTGSEASFTYVPPPLSAMYGTGNNTYGQLGLGTTGGTNNTFAALTGNWGQVACGSNHTMALSAGTTKLFGTGYNFSGQLGLGQDFDTIDYNKNTLTALTGNWGQFACGGDYTMTLSAGTGALFATGANNFGQLGMPPGSRLCRNTFTQLTGNWGQFACGGAHTMALSAGTTRLYGTGYNYSGQLGLGDSDLGTDRSTFTQLTGNWSQVACGASHTMTLSAGTNALFGTGSNSDGQLGTGNTTRRNRFVPLTGNWSQVACGASHTMALSAGTTRLFSTGANNYGQLGLGTTGGTFYTLTQVAGNWSQVVCGDNHTMALSAGTTQWYSTGRNSDGQLALGDTTLRNTFTALTAILRSQLACGSNFTMASWY